MIYITGLHRAGTHSLAKYLAERDNLFYADENLIEWDNLDAAIKLKNKLVKKYDDKKNEDYWVKLKTDKDIVLQCPGLAHETEELSKHGKVYWCSRNNLNVAISMSRGGFNQMSWHIMNQFKAKFPNDLIWEQVSYNGKEDRHYGFIEYNALLVRVKEYFYETKFKRICENQLKIRENQKK